MAKVLSKLEEMKAKLEVAKLEQAKKLEEAIEMRTLEMELNKLSNPLMVERELSKTSLSKLDEYIGSMENIHTETTIRKVFGYGVLVDKLLTIARTVQYSKLEVKGDLLLSMNLDEVNVEDVNEYLGNTSYFNPKTGEINEEVECQLPELKEALSIMASDLGVEVDLNKLTQSKIDRMYKSAKAKAEGMREETAKHLKKLEAMGDSVTTNYEE